LLDGEPLFTATDRVDVERAFSRFPNAGKMQKLSREDRDDDRAAFTRLLAATSDSRQWLSRLPPAELALVRRSLRNVITLYDWHEAVRADVSTEIAWDDNIALNNVRDRAMADNLRWLSHERFPNAKIIVWAASMHIARSLSDVDASNTRFKPRLYDGFRPMGDVAEEWLPHQIYRIAFTSFDGETGLTGKPKARISDVPAAGSVEWWFHDAGSSYAFADLRATPENPADTPRGRRSAAFLGHVPFGADWSRVFDGAFFIRTMSASTALPAGR
jgi:erythromycin esterase-like protein